MGLNRCLPFRRVVVAICVALAVMLSGQAYISLMDRIDHAHHHVHFANPLAGDLEVAVVHLHDTGHYHDHGWQKAAQHDSDHGDRQHVKGTTDHQHGDAALVFLAAQSFVLLICPLPELRRPTATRQLVSFSPLGPDHPPKSTLEI